MIAAALIFIALPLLLATIKAIRAPGDVDNSRFLGVGGGADAHSHNSEIDRG